MTRRKPCPCQIPVSYTHLIEVAKESEVQGPIATVSLEDGTVVEEYGDGIVFLYYTEDPSSTMAREMCIRDRKRNEQEKFWPIVSLLNIVVRSY